MGDGKHGQDADTIGIRICDNDITTAGAIIFNVNGSGITMDDSVICNNLFDDGAGGTAVSIVGINCVINGNVDLTGDQTLTDCVINGNANMPGTYTLTNCIATSNTGGGTFNEGASGVVANNI